MNFPLGYEPENIPVDEPGKRRAILVLPRGTIERVFYDPTNSKFKKSIATGNSIKNGLLIIEDSIELYNKNSQDFLQKLNKRGLIQSGNILIQNAYKTSDYFKFDEDQIKSEVIFTKWRHYVTVCNYLGAENIELNNEKDKNIDSNKNFLGKIIIPFLNLGIDGKSFAKKIEKELYEMSAKSTGGLPNIELTENYINDESLSEDKDIDFLVKNRAVALKDKAKNPTAFYDFKQTLNLFSQIENGFELAANIEIPQYLVNGNVQFKQSNKRIEKFITEIKLTFSKEVERN